LIGIDAYGSGTSATTTGVRNLIAIGDDFKTPRTQQWNVGYQRMLYRRGSLDIGYVGSQGEHLRVLAVRLPGSGQPSVLVVARLDSPWATLVRL
jgi:hypothetical protein